MSEVLDAAKTLKDTAKQFEAIDTLTVLAPNAFHGDATKLSLWKELRSDMVVYAETRAKIAMKSASDEVEGDMRQTEIDFKVREPAREEPRVEMKVLTDGENGEEDGETEDTPDADWKEVPEEEPEEAEEEELETATA